MFVVTEADAAAIRAVYEQRPSALQQDKEARRQRGGTPSDSDIIAM